MTDPTTSSAASPAASPAARPDSPPPDVIVLTRRRIDRLLVLVGTLVTLVLLVAGGLLLWGATFAEDYVDRELSAQNITFPPEDALREEGRDDLADLGGELVNTGSEAEQYASYIAGHIENIGGGLSYAELGGPQREAQAAVEDAIAAGAPQEEIDALRAEADAISGQRDTVFRGEILRGTLLNTYAWWTIGRIAFIAAISAFVAAALMAVLVVLGIMHLRRVESAAGSG